MDLYGIKAHVYSANGMTMQCIGPDLVLSPCHLSPPTMAIFSLKLLVYKRVDFEAGLDVALK